LVFLLNYYYRYIYISLQSNVPDPKVFQPPSSSKNSKKTFISTVLWLLYDFLSLKNEVKVALSKNKKLGITIFLSSWRSLTKREGSVSRRHGSADQNLCQHVKDPEHCKPWFLLFRDLKTSLTYYLWRLMSLYLQKEISNNNKTWTKITYFLLASWKPQHKSRIRFRVHNPATCADPRNRVRIKLSRIRNTGKTKRHLFVTLNR
jgi:hypothetical protein